MGAGMSTLLTWGASSVSQWSIFTLYSSKRKMQFSATGSWTLRFVWPHLLYFYYTLSFMVNDVVISWLKCVPNNGLECYHWFWNVFLVTNHWDVASSFSSNLIWPSSSFVDPGRKRYPGHKRKNTLMAMALPNLPGHQKAKFAGWNRACPKCSKHRHKTSSGRTPETILRCSRCGVNLCRSGCFVQYHTENSTLFSLNGSITMLCRSWFWHCLTDYMI